MALYRTHHILRIHRAFTIIPRVMSTGQFGDGAGKGGGTGGSIRDAGGSFGKREAAKEEEYFRRLQGDQFKKLNQLIDQELHDHEEQIKHHKEAIEHHEKQIGLLKQAAKDN